LRIVLVNPNTTHSMTDRMASAACQVVGDGVEIVPLTSPYGPPSIEGFYDEAFAVPPMIEAVRDLDGPVDGIVVGCFDDTGVHALRAMTDAPVIGICQAALQTASVLGNGLSVVTTLDRSVPALEKIIQDYGFERQCRRVRATDVPVLDLEDPKSGARSAIEREIGRALEDDRAEVVVLGCAGMVDLSVELSRTFGVPVVEGVTAAVKILEGMVTLGLKTSPRRGYAAPRPKTYGGIFSGFSPK